MRSLACYIALALTLGACTAPEGVPDAGLRTASLARVDLGFTRDTRGIHFGAQAYFARFRPGEDGRAATLLGLGHDDRIPLDSCTEIDGAAELDRAFSGSGSADVELLDAGQVTVRGPGQATQLGRRRYPDLTPEVTGVIYSTAEGSAPVLEPGALYELSGDGGEEIGPFQVVVPAPRAFPALESARLRNGGDVELRWTPAGPGGEKTTETVFITVSWVLRTGAREVHCRVRDTGSFVIPPSYLASLPTDEEALGQVEVMAARLRQSTFTAPGVGPRGGLATLTLRDVVPLTAAAP
ncbi:MAG TPA: hypothetical protein VH877_12650 [Polyangia bacterium]|jgi:hypothetical protein|nr:hypothetical protein [Polyangia bacterium]